MSSGRGTPFVDPYLFRQDHSERNQLGRSLQEGWSNTKASNSQVFKANTGLQPFVIADGVSRDLEDLIRGISLPAFKIGSTDDPIGLISKVLNRQRQEGQFV